MPTPTLENPNKDHFKQFEIPSAISSQNLQGAAPINITQPQVPPVPTVPSPVQPQADGQGTDPLSAIEQQLQASLGGKDQALAAKTLAATAPHQQRLSQLDARIAGFDASVLKRQETALSQGDTLAYSTGLAGQVARTDSIERLTLLAERQAISGDIAAAERTAKIAVDAQFAEQEAKNQAARQNIIDNYDNFTSAEKKRADAALLKLDKDDAFVADQKATRTLVSQAGIKAREFGADDATVQKILNADSYEEAIMVAGESLRDPKAKYELAAAELDVQLKKAQIAKTKADTAKVVSETGTAGASIPSISDTGAGASGVKAQVLGRITGLKLNQDQGNAVSYAFRMIEANSNINNQLTKGVGNFNPTTIISAIGRGFRSDNARALDRDLENFIRAQLRKESGAQIADTEMAGGRQIYSPQGIMTDANDIKATKATREQAIQSMIAQAGPAAPALKDYYEYMNTGGLSPEDREIIYGGVTSTPALISGQRYF